MLTLSDANCSAFSAFISYFICHLRYKGIAFYARSKTICKNNTPEALFIDIGQVFLLLTICEVKQAFGAEVEEEVGNAQVCLEAEALCKDLVVGAHVGLG